MTDQHAPRALSPQQEQIASYLRDQRDRDVTASELRAAVCPDATIKTIHVQVCRMRKAAAPIKSAGSPRPGYRWTGPVDEFRTHENESAINDEMPDAE